MEKINKTGIDLFAQELSNISQLGSWGYRVDEGSVFIDREKKTVSFQMRGALLHLLSDELGDGFHNNTSHNSIVIDYSKIEKKVDIIRTIKNAVLNVMKEQK